MHFHQLLTNVAIVALTVFPFVGCGSQGDSAKQPPKNQSGTVVDEHGHDHAHHHPTEGPHHGSLIELGKEEYHAELVHDEEQGTVTIYLLDSEAKNAVPIDAPQLVVNVKYEGQPRQFNLTPAPDSSDPEGKTSRFVSNEQALGIALDAEGSNARLMVTINGKSYSGDLTHTHGDHDHDH